MELHRQHYTVQDFLADPQFKEWVLHRRNEVLWEDFLQCYPHKREEVKTARQLLLTLATPIQQSRQEKKSEVWQAVASQLDMPSSRNSPPHLNARLRYLPWLGAACILLIFSIIYFSTTDTAPRYLEYQTESGQEKLIVLPDSSEVLLIGKSKLRYVDKWGDDTFREVWVEGNAYFNVKHTQQSGLHVRPYDRFIVHTASEGKIEVLGTTFSVSTISEKELVYLETGSIRLSYGDQVLSLAPGEVAYLAGNKLMRQSESSMVIIWSKKELVLESAPLREVIDLYHQVYGATITLPLGVDPDQLLEGTIPFGRAEEVIEALSLLLNEPLMRNITPSED